VTRDVVLGLGANLGSRLASMRCVLDVIGSRFDVRVVATSRVYETEPVGPPQPLFLNAAARVCTELSLRALLERALEAERLLGRERRERWGPRTVDVDLLYAGDERIDEPGLTVPHPRLTERPFALAPTLDVWPEAPPGLHRALEELGGAPPARGEVEATTWRVTERDGELRAEATDGDRDDSLAAALTGLGRTLARFERDATAPLEARVGWCGRPGDPEACLRILVEGLAAGFRPMWVTLTPADDRLAVRLIGRAGDPPRVAPEPRGASVGQSNGRPLARVGATMSGARVESAK